ncbi:pantoate--beta-alanine ligase [Corynebacterium breve]|uniref:pantoate--beta-alanine ligase (AMP-forming) n=1 Tax=Corynebacterium breve TaxID=3049799 RepID=A0ABY8VCZ4_9CORY|nr:pantoate--beta-alanine ligase [Corynebacterium breve]WIM67363.1 pantoate--beta-alanine ligase [Corynebacterium breve]
MTFQPGHATVVTDPALFATYGRAFRKTGKRVVLVPLGSGVHAGHIALIRAARSLAGAITMVTYSGDEVPEDFAKEKVDVVFHGSLDTHGIAITSGLEHLEEPSLIDDAVTRIIAATIASSATDVVAGEKDFETLVALQHAVAGLHLNVQLHSVPTVRMPDGLAISRRNADVAEDQRDKAVVIAAALTAGAHVAEHGHAVILETARGVLEAGGVTPSYLELRDLDFGPAPELGDARLLVGVDLGGVHLVDNVGVPVGIGFKNIEE